MTITFPLEYVSKGQLKPSLQRFYGPYQTEAERDAAMPETIPEYLPCVVNGIEYWYVGNTWVPKNSGGNSVTGVNVAGRFSVLLDNDSIILDDNTSSEDIALYSTNIEVFDAEASPSKVTSKCTNWSVEKVSGPASEISATCTNGVVTYTRTAVTKLTIGVYVFRYSWKYIIKSSKGDDVEVVMSKTLLITIKDFSDGETYSLVVYPNNLKLNSSQTGWATSSEINLQVNKIKSGEITNVTDLLAFDFKYQYEGDDTEYTCNKNFTAPFDTRNILIKMYYRGILLDQETINVMANGLDSKVLSLSNPTAILDDNTVDDDDIGTATYTTLNFSNGVLDVEDVTATLSTNLARGFVLLVKNIGGTWSNYSETDKGIGAYRLKLLVTPINNKIPATVGIGTHEVTFKYKGYEVILKIKIADISLGEVFSLNASPQFIYVTNKGVPQNNPTILLTKTYKGDTSDVTSETDYTYKYKWGSGAETECTLNDSKQLVISNVGENDSNLYVRVYNGLNLVDETEVLYVKQGNDGESVVAGGWTASIDNDGIILDDDYYDSVYKDTSKTKVTITHNGNDVTLYFTLKTENAVELDTSGKFKAILETDTNDTYYFNAEGIANGSKITTGLGTIRTGNVHVTWVLKPTFKNNATNGKVTIDGTEVDVNFSLTTYQSYVIADFSDGCSYKLIVTPNSVYSEFNSTLYGKLFKVYLVKYSPNKDPEYVNPNDYSLYTINNTGNETVISANNTTITKYLTYWQITKDVGSDLTFEAKLNGKIVDSETVTYSSRGEAGTNGALNVELCSASWYYKSASTSDSLGIGQANAFKIRLGDISYNRVDSYNSTKFTTKWTGSDNNVHSNQINWGLGLYLLELDTTEENASGIILNKYYYPSTIDSSNFKQYESLFNQVQTAELIINDLNAIYERKHSIIVLNYDVTTITTAMITALRKFGSTKLTDARYPYQRCVYYLVGHPNLEEGLAFEYYKACTNYSQAPTAESAKAYIKIPWNVGVGPLWGGKNGTNGTNGIDGKSPLASDVAKYVKISGVLRFKGEWKESTAYTHLETTSGNAEWTDYVQVTTLPSYDADNPPENITYSISNYKCKTAHTSSESNKPGSGTNWTTYWEIIGREESLVAGVIDASKIATKELYLKDVNENITGGALGGSLLATETPDKKIFFFAGSNYNSQSDATDQVTMENAPFRVYANGDVVARNLISSGWNLLLPFILTGVGNTIEYLKNSDSNNLNIDRISKVLYTGNYSSGHGGSFGGHVMVKSNSITNLVNPNKLGKFNIVDVNQSIILPSFYSEYNPSDVELYYLAPGIYSKRSYQYGGKTFNGRTIKYKDLIDLYDLDEFKTSGESNAVATQKLNAAIDAAKKYMAYCRQFIGNKVICAVKSSNITGTFGRHYGGSITCLHSTIESEDIDIIAKSGGDYLVSPTYVSSLDVKFDSTQTEIMCLPSLVAKSRKFDNLEVIGTTKSDGSYTGTNSNFTTTITQINHTEEEDMTETLGCAMANSITIYELECCYYTTDDSKCTLGIDSDTIETSEHTEEAVYWKINSKVVVNDPEWFDYNVQNVDLTQSTEDLYKLFN